MKVTKVVFNKPAAKIILIMEDGETTYPYTTYRWPTPADVKDDFQLEVAGAKSAGVVTAPITIYAEALASPDAVTLYTLEDGWLV